jgi:hypothetical protein
VKPICPFHDPHLSGINEFGFALLFLISETGPSYKPGLQWKVRWVGYIRAILWYFALETILWTVVGSNRTIRGRDIFAELTSGAIYRMALVVTFLKGIKLERAEGSAGIAAFSRHEVEAELFFSFQDLVDPASHKVVLDIFDRSVCQYSGFLAVIQFEGDLDLVLFFEILKPQDPKTDSYSRNVFGGQPAGLHRSHIGVAPAELYFLPIMLADFQEPVEGLAAFASDSHITVDGYGVFEIEGLSEAATRACDQPSSFRCQIALGGRQN